MYSSLTARNGIDKTDSFPVAPRATNYQLPTPLKATLAGFEGPWYILEGYDVKQL